MDYEKKYKETLERARKLYYSEETSAEVMIACENVFPELKESEDERISKSILSAVKYLETEFGWDTLGDVDILDTYAWLEKQGEQKWSEKDEQHIDSLLKRLEGLCRNEFERTRFAINEDSDWLKSLKERY